MKFFRITALCTDFFGCDLEEISYTVPAETENEALTAFNAKVKNEKIFCNVKEITNIIVL